MLSSLLLKLEDLRNGREADFQGKKIISEELRGFLLQLEPAAGKTPRCFIRNAEFEDKVDLSDSREPSGGALPALEFHGCTFHAGFCGDGAHLDRLKFYCCRFVAHEDADHIRGQIEEECAGSRGSRVGHERQARKLQRPVNCISLRHSRIETELRLEYLSPVDWHGKPGVLTVDAFAIRVGTNVHISDTTLRAQAKESGSISEEAHYALHLATASVGGDVQLMPNVVLDGGLKMRDAQVAGSFWGMGLRVTDGEERSPNELIRIGYTPRFAISLDTTEIQGNLVLTGFLDRSFRAVGNVSLRNVMVVGDAYLVGDVDDSVLMQGATVKGELGIYGRVRALYGQQTTTEGDSTFACSGIRFLLLNGASIRGTLDISNSTFTGPYLPDVRAIAESDELLCYPGMKLIELLCTTFDPNSLFIATLLVSEEDRKKPILLDGYSRRLHDLNRDTPESLQLETPEQMTEYLKLFCASAWGEKGSFAIVDDRFGLPETIDRENIDPAIQVISQAARWVAKAYVRYGDQLFKATFEVHKDGRVSMADDEQVAKYDGVSDTARLAKFARPYRLAPENFGRYRSDFMGAHPLFKALTPDSKEERRWAAALMQAASSQQEFLYSRADVSGASCKKLIDWRVLPTGPFKPTPPILVWPKRQISLEDFDYRQLSRADDLTLRLPWVRRAPALPELYRWFALAQFLVTITCIGIFVAVSVAFAWLWTVKLANPTDESSAHFGWRFLAVLAVLSCVGLFAASRFRNSPPSPETGFFRNICLFWLRLLLRVAKMFPRRKSFAKFRHRFIVTSRLLLRRARQRNRDELSASSFSAQPYAHLAAVLRERGDDLAARDVEAEKMWQEAVARGRTDYWHWLAKFFLWRPYGVMFGFGLSPKKAFISLLCFWCLGWGATYLLSNNGMLRANVATVAPEVLIEGKTAPKPALESSPQGRLVPANFSCEEAIEPALYSFELMTPIVNLHQDSRCELRSKPKDHAGNTPKIKIAPRIHLPQLFSYGWLWEYAKAVYMVVGSVITSLALLTVSGIARRWEH